MRKKWFYILLILILSCAFFSACGNGEKGLEKSTGFEEKGGPEEEEIFGTFYNLQTAYDFGYITENDIEQIAEKHHYHEFVPLTEEETLEIRKAYVKRYPREDAPQIGYESVVIKESLGKYKDCHALLLHYNDIGVPLVAGDEIIAGITIHYGDEFRIVIYNGIDTATMNKDNDDEKEIGTNGKFFSIQSALDNGIITMSDVAVIAEKHNTGNYDEPTAKETLAIKKAYAKNYPRDEATYETVVIEQYLGRYNDCFAVLLHYSDEYAVTVVWSETFGDVCICYGNGFSIKIYQEED